MKYYVVTGRIAFDVEDIVRVVWAANAADANAKMIQILMPIAEAKKGSDEELTGVIVTAIVECSDEEPRIIFSAGDN